MLTHIPLLTFAFSLASAFPAQSLTARQECYPYFIAGLPSTCALYNPTAQISSGHAVFPPPSVICQPIGVPGANPPQAFPAASVNPNNCADDLFAVTLYTTSDCSDPGQVFTVPQCLQAPGAGWVSYSAVPVAGAPAAVG